MTRLLVVGEGIGATAFLNALVRTGKVDNFSSITQIASESLAPATSLRSTGIAALRGTREGLSPLGNEQVAHWRATEQLLEREQWAGLARIELQSWVYTEKSHRRYGHLPQSQAPVLPMKIPARYVSREEGWIVTPEVLLKSMPLPPLKKLTTLVTQLVPRQGEWVATVLGGEEFVFDKVVLATGVWSEWMRELVSETPLMNLRSYQGSYYQWQSKAFGEKSFSLIIEGANLVYEATAGRLLLGATSVADEWSFVADQKALREVWDKFHHYCDVELPPLESAAIRTGLRPQTRARTPWVGELRPGLFAFNGLYKTGWVSSFPLAEKLTQII